MAKPLKDKLEDMVVKTMVLLAFIFSWGILIYGLTDNTTVGIVALMSFLVDFALFTGFVLYLVIFDR